MVETNFNLGWEFEDKEIDAKLELNDDIKNELLSKLLSLEEDKKELFRDSVTFTNTYGDYAFKDFVEEWRNKTFKDKEENYFKNIQIEIFDLLLRKQRAEATERIVEEFYKKYRIIVSRDDKNPEFMVYNNGIYLEEGRTYIEEFTRNILGKNVLSV